MNIYCQNNKGFKWYQDNDVFVKGYLFDKKNKLFKDKDLIEFFQNAKTLIEFESILKEANGFFIVIKKIKNEWAAAVDRIRSIPIFFTQFQQEIFISDDAFLLNKKFGNSEINQLQKSAFLKSGHTLNNSTLIDSVQQLEAGQYLFFTNNKINIKTYYSHLRGNYQVKNKEQQFEELGQISRNVFQRLVDFANGRQLVVPLSGGYDSRYIVAMLKELGYKNVFCYTYGIPSSYEVKMAKKVIDELKYKWHFVKYPMSWKSYYDCIEYQIYASQLCSLPHEQDFLAIQELKEKQLIEDDAIVVPGFCGDLLGGSVIPNFYKKNKKINNHDLVKHIYETEFCYENKIGKYDEKKIHQSVLSNIINEREVIDVEMLTNIHEEFFTKNLVSKYVVNELRVFDFFNYQWTMPLWDNELIDWWYQVPNTDRVGEHKRYDQFLLEVLFKKHNIAFPKHRKNAPSHFIKQILGNRLMKLGRVAFINSPFYNDINGTLQLLKLLQKDLKKTKRDGLITTKPNKIMAAWYMYLLEENKIKNF